MERAAPPFWLLSVLFPPTARGALQDLGQWQPHTQPCLPEAEKLISSGVAHCLGGEDLVFQGHGCAVGWMFSVSVHTYFPWPPC